MVMEFSEVVDGGKRGAPLPVTTVVAMAPVVVVTMRAHPAAVAAAPRVDAERTVDGADRPAHRPADDASDGPADPVALGCAAAYPAGQPLGIGDDG
jgi:hypothetical protein